MQQFNFIICNTYLMIPKDSVGSCQIGLVIRLFVMSDATGKKTLATFQANRKEIDENGGERADPKGIMRKKGTEAGKSLEKPKLYQSFYPKRY